MDKGWLASELSPISQQQKTRYQYLWMFFFCEIYWFICGHKLGPKSPVLTCIAVSIIGDSKAVNTFLLNKPRTTHSAKEFVYKSSEFHRSCFWMTSSIYSPFSSILLAGNNLALQLQHVPLSSPEKSIIICDLSLVTAQCSSQSL